MKARASAVLGAWLAWVGSVSARPPQPAPLATRDLFLVADQDDDDADGVPDGDQAHLDARASTDAVAADRSWIGAELALEGAELVRVLRKGRPATWPVRIASGDLLQGRAPGVAFLKASKSGATARFRVEVVGWEWRDGTGERVDWSASHASIARTPPGRLDSVADGRFDDPDALRLVLMLPVSSTAAGPWSVESVAASGASFDTLPVPMTAATCPEVQAGIRCLTSEPLRFVMDDVDRSHPLAASRSLRSEVGGAVVVRDSGGRKLQAIRVLGPRRSPVGPMLRLRATLRAFVMRIGPGGAPSIGGNEAGAIAAARSELALASALWGQCGVTFGPLGGIQVQLVDPPPPHLVAIGDDAGLPAAQGGEIRVRIDHRPVAVSFPRGATPDRVGAELARAGTRAGFVATISPNARISPGAAGSVDLSFRRKDGRPAVVEPGLAGGILSSDPSLAARIGVVDLSDGLQHFGDMDSVAGTLEERALLKALDDGDPQTLDVVFVPAFAGGMRIGESFISSDLSSLRNVVLLDRAGVRARRSSHTLAHELGHVLMDLPGHPDDYGIDTPSRLMDSDASDASAYGPRRLTVEECARVVRQSGPRARMPLLREWKLGPLPVGHRTLPVSAR